MNLYTRIVNKKEKISVIGLGYVGLPIAVAFANKANVIGFDIDEEKIKQYKKGIDPTKEVGDTAIKQTSVDFTSNELKLIPSFDIINEQHIFSNPSTLVWGIAIFLLNPVDCSASRSNTKSTILFTSNMEVDK